MRAFFLSFENSPRFARASEQLRGLARHYPAQMVLGYDRDATITDRFHVALGAKRYLTETPLGAGDVCCYRSHLAVCRQIIALGLPWGHVFEDDAFLKPNAASALAALDENLAAKEGWGFVTLHHDEVIFEKVRFADAYKWSDELLSGLLTKPMLMHGYTISREMAEMILKKDSECGQTSNWDFVSRETSASHMNYRVKASIAGLAEFASVRTRCDAGASLADMVGTRIMCLNLERHTKRRARMERIAEQLGWNLHFVKAIDGRQVEPIEGVNMSDVGCSLSHMGMWQGVVASGQPWLLLEDDVIFCKDFRAQWSAPRELPMADITYLGISWPEVDAPVNGVSNVRKCWGLFAYILTPEGARKLLEAFHANPNQSSDKYPRNLIAEGKLTGQVINPSLAVGQWAESSIAPRVTSAKMRYGNIFSDPFADHVGGTPEWINHP